MARHVDRSIRRRTLALAGIALFVAGLCSNPVAAQPQVPGSKYKQWVYFHQPRAYPSTTIPGGAYAAARQQYERAFGHAPGQAAPVINQNTWGSIGPAPITNTGWNPTNSGQFNQTGRINSIAVDPTNNNVIYIGAATGGVWKTTDGGTTWTPLTDNQCSLAMGSVAIDPSNHNVVYAGTGEENFSGDSYYGCGVLKSTDGGATWTQLGASIFQTSTGGARIARVVINPSNTNTLLVASDFGLYRSTDAGANFSLVQTGVATDVVIDPTTPATAYAAIGNIFGAAANGVYKSTDSGATWARAGNFPTFPASNVGRINLAIAASSSTTVYAGVQDTNTFGLLDVFKTTNGGTSWSGLGSTGLDCDGQCWYDMYLAVDPTNPNTVYFGGLSVFKSTNGGTSFSNIGGSTRCEVLHCDHHGFAFQPGSATTFYDGNDGGIYKTTDGGATWTTLNTNLAISQFYPGFAPHPTTATTAFGGTQDNGYNLYTGANAWTNMPVYGDGGFAAIDFNNANTAYEGGNDCGAGCGGPQRSDNFNLGAAATWNAKVAGINLNDRRLFIPPLAMSPTNSQRLYYATFQLYRTINRGDAWGSISPDLTKSNCGFGPNCSISAVVEAKSNSQVIYVGTSDGNVQVTQTGVAPWTLITSGLPNRAVTYLAVDPTNAQNVFVTFSGFGTGHVFKSTNAGTNWTNISANLPNIPVNTILLDPGAPTTNIYIGTDLGVFMTANGGASWSPFDNGLPQVPVLDLVFNAGTNVLMAATHGRSAFQATFVAPAPVLVVSPATNMASSGPQGGPFAPASFQYQLSTTTGTAGYSITGLPSWLTASSTSGTVDTSGTTITFTVNASANTLAPGTYGPTTITFANTTNGQGNTTRTATLTVNPVPALIVTPATNISSSGIQGGPFSPSSFQYQLSATTGTVNYSISGLPSWLTASSTSGTVDTTGTTVTFTVNASANALTPGTYGPTVITFANSSGPGTTTRLATLTVNAPPGTLVVSPAANIASTGNQGGPFSPSSFQYQLASTGGTIGYSISGVPSWLTASSTSGTVDTGGTTVTFTVNASANTLAAGTYGPTTITFTNTTNNQGNTNRTATLTVSGVCTLASQLGDFNGDGRDDLAFRRTSDGLISLYLMDTFTILAAQAIGTLDPNFTLTAVADFNGDGRADFLFRRASDGMLAMYLMNGFQVISAQLLGTLGTDWDFVGTADFNGDGRADILFRRINDGMLSLYLMNGPTILAAQQLGTLGTEWRVRGVRDFNGDGRADILFFRVADGGLALYEYDGFQRLAFGLLGSVGAGFDLVGVRDFNGDGRADILFRRTSDGMLAMYLMNGFQLVASQLIGAVGTDIAVLGLGDLNGDGRSDIVFRRKTDGLLAIYIMNGFQVVATGSLGVLGTEFSACYGQPPLQTASR